MSLNNNLIKSIRSDYFISKHKTISTKEVQDRVNKFEVIRDKELDLISLNSLYDFLGLKFNNDRYKVKCGYCKLIVSELIICQKCDNEVCNYCSAIYNQFTQIDYDCCNDCGEESQDFEMW